MAFELSWHVENKVIWMSGSGQVSLENIASSAEVVSSWIESSDEPLVHVLVDVRHAEFAADSMQIRARANAASPILSHERCGWVILIGQNNPVANFISSTVTQIFKVRFKTFKTAEKALEFLIEVAPNIETVPALPE